MKTSSGAHVESSTDPGRTRSGSAKRLVGIDAARGLALVGMMAIHILPAWSDSTGEATLSWKLFSGHAAALFALLAGVSLALTSGGTRPHEGRRMAADRVGIAVRGVLITAVGLWIGTLMPEDPPAYNILVYYGMFFLLAIPFLHLRAQSLLVSGVVCCLAAPLLIQGLIDQLPEWSSYNPTLGTVLAEPGGVLSQLLLTGSYPALAYLTYLLVGMALGRLNLRETNTQVRLVVLGGTVAIVAHATSYILLYVLGGYQRLLDASQLGEEGLDEVLVWGPDHMPTFSTWWLAVTTPHSNTPLAIAASLGVGVAALGVLLLIARQAETWLLPLSAMGAMTLTLYTAHLVALSLEVHYDQPHLWYAIHLGVAAVLAVLWRLTLGQGPLERLVALGATGARRLVMGRSPATPS